MARTDWTLATALAFLHITDTKRGVHISTLIRMTSELYTFDHTRYLKERRFHFLTEAGLALVNRSAMFKAHEAMLAAGFEVDNSGNRKFKHRYRLISYHHVADSNSDDWKFARTGHIYYAGGRAYAYAQAEMRFPQHVGAMYNREKHSAQRISEYRNG